jgi:dipeptide transport system permease protein
MLRFVLTRLSLVIPTFIGITFLAFVLIRLVPGDPIETLAGERGIDPVRHEALRKEYGFDRPVLVQYAIYIGRLLHGDFGRSIITHEPVLRNSRRCFRRPSSWEFPPSCWPWRSAFLPACWPPSSATPSSIMG